MIIRDLTKLTDRVLGRPHREVISEPASSWIKFLRRFSEYYDTLYSELKKGPDEVRLKQIHIEPSAACELRCRGCNNSNYRFPDGFMPMKTAIKVIDEAYETVGKDCVFGFFIRGEATLHPQLAEMIAYARDRGIQHLLLTTNLVKVDNTLAKDLLNAGLTEIRFSVDGADKESFEKMRSGGDFDRVCDAINFFVDQREKLGVNCHFRLHAALGEEGFYRVPDFVRRWQDAVDEFKFTVAVNQGGLSDSEEALELAGMPFAVATTYQVPCRILFDSAGVTWDGKVTSCCVDYGENFVSGTLEEGIENSFLNDFSENLRSAQKNGSFGPFCSQCGFANALVDWFEDEVNDYVKLYQRELMDPGNDERYRQWLKKCISKFNWMVNDEICKR